ncbi:MAG: hypothetical protein JWL99_7068 [Streptomyces oryziradicis]|nr:hypothetical protein [Actinacidiphila oryziradicis]
MQLTTRPRIATVTAMTHDIARHLWRAGQWDAALRQLPDDPAGATLRAEMVVDRHLWRLDPPDEAVAAIKAIECDEPERAALLTAQLEYWRQFLSLGGTPLGGDPVAAFAALAGHDPLAGWAVFWHAVTLDNLRHDAEGAAAGYGRARTLAVAADDLLLESYAVRHLGGQAVQNGDAAPGLALLRRSLHLRAAIGARPHTAAAQAALADALGEVPEAAGLRAIAAGTARELGLTWLKADA